ncbi:MAG: TetR/AcrR family transcriptional regulator [Acidimicrobiales bacterium]
MRVDGQRSDAQTNRRRLIDATEALLATQGSFTLTDLATEAGVSRATTYRNFASPNDAVTAFISEFLSEFEDAISDEGSVVANIEEVCLAWGDLVERRSSALVKVRSTEGFLARTRSGDSIICRIDALVRAAILLDDHGSTLSQSDLDYAVFLWNLLLDPRELLDLGEHCEANVRAATLRMSAEFMACLRRIPGQES